jgi:diadenosine tetraphosphatase ApaH/serine/threonine PP2A family protein phosphatase
MLIGVFSDVHSNLHAMEAVLDDMESEGVKRKYYLGDIVGYGAFPKRCLQLLRELGCQAILGNHDEAVGREDYDMEFNPLAREGVRFSRAQLEEEEKSWLTQLPHVIRVRGAVLVHSCLYLPEEWLYVLGPEDADVHFKRQRGRLCFCGHTHVPCVWEQGKELHFHRVFEEEKRIEKTSRYLVNVGSVGQPRDHQPEACYVIWDNRQQTIRFRRVPYEVESACQSILDAGLPSLLGQRLFEGR